MASAGELPMNDMTSEAGTHSVASMLEAVELRGKTWCYIDLSEMGGFSVRPSEAALLHVILSGEVVLAQRDAKPLRLSAGSAVVVTTGQAHAVRVSATAPAPTLDFLCAEQGMDIPASFAFGRGRSYSARLLTARLRLTRPEGMSRSIFPPVIALGGPSVAGCGGLDAALLQRHSSGPGATVVMTRLASAMLADALRREMLGRKTKAFDAEDPLERARQMVELDPGKDWTVETLARAVGMGRSNFSAQFTQAWKKSPMEFVTDVRMRRASHLVRHGTLPIPEIGEAVGYGCESAFTRRFSKHFGVSPSAMRTKDDSSVAKPSRFGDLSVLLGRPRSALIARGDEDRAAPL